MILIKITKKEDIINIFLYLLDISILMSGFIIATLLDHFCKLFIADIKENNVSFKKNSFFFLSNLKKQYISKQFLDII